MTRRSRNRDGLLLLSGALIVSLLAAVYGRVLVKTAASPLSDFGMFLLGLRAQLAGGSFYDVTEAGRHWGAPYADNLIDLAPPHLHLLLVPLLSIRFDWAYGLWVGINVLAFAWTALVVTRELGLAWRDVTIVWSLVAVLAGHAATVACLVNGQYVWLLNVPCVLAWRALRQNRWLASFAWLGLVLSFKPYPLALAAYALWRRRLDAVGLMLLVAIATIAVGAAIFGASAYAAWLQALQKGGALQVWMFGNVSVFGVTARAMAPSPAFVPLVDATRLGDALAAAAAAGIAVVTALRVRYLDADHAWAASWLAAFLAVPLSWGYYVWFILPAVVAIVRQERWRQSLLPFACIIAFVVPPMLPNVFGWTSVSALVTGGLLCYAGAAMWWHITWPPKAAMV